MTQTTVTWLAVLSIINNIPAKTTHNKVYHIKTCHLWHNGVFLPLRLANSKRLGNNDQVCSWDLVTLHQLKSIFKSSLSSQPAVQQRFWSKYFETPATVFLRAGCQSRKAMKAVLRWLNINLVTNINEVESITT